MPELPEVETVCRGLASAMTGQVIVSAMPQRPDLRVPFPENLAARVRGCTIEGLSRRAKYILASLDSGEVLVFHLGMSGQMMVVPEAAAYQPKKHDHLILALASGEGVVFNDARRFGMVLLVAGDTMETHPSFRSMGPEPLTPDFTGHVLKERLGVRKTPIKVALLDQGIVAGVGNIYASEALNEAGLSPMREAGSLSARQADRLAGAIKNVLTRAIEAGGSTLKDFRKADGKPGYFQHSFSVYDREGAACPVCARNGKKKAVIHKTMQAGRATYYCPSCQK